MGMRTGPALLSTYQSVRTTVIARRWKAKSQSRFFTVPRDRPHVPAPSTKAAVFRPANECSKHPKPGYPATALGSRGEPRGTAVSSVLGCGSCCRTLGLRTRPQGDGEASARPNAQKPAWLRRLERRIETTRVKIGRLKLYKQGSRSKRVVRRVAEIVKPAELRDLTEASITEILDTHVQRLSALAKRMRRYG